MMQTATQPPQGSGIKLCPDGKYRWAYEYSLWRNPTILFTILKIFGGLFAVGAVFMLIGVGRDMAGGYATTDDAIETGRNMAFFALLFAVLILVSYAIYAAMNGGKYCVLFTMDDVGVVHEQMPQQVKKAEVIGAINVLIGAASGSPTQVGIGLTSPRSTTSSDFSAVRSIEGNRRRGVIKVNEPFAKNQVYVERGDYDFVYDCIRSRCPNAQRVKG